MTDKPTETRKPTNLVARAMTPREVGEFFRVLEPCTLIEADHYGLPEQFFFVGKSEKVTGGYVLRYASPEHNRLGRYFILENLDLLCDPSIITKMSAEEFAKIYRLPEEI